MISKIPGDVDKNGKNLENGELGKRGVMIIKNRISENLDMFKKMVSIHGNLNHPAIIPLLDFYITENQYFNYVLPCMKNKDLSALLHSIDNYGKPKRWNNTKMLINIIGIVSGMKYIHNNSVIHCNLKPENIILDDNFYPLINNFLCSKIVDKKNNNDNPCGTPLYMAPELIGEEGNTYKSDVYSFSIILYQLTTNKRFDLGLGQNPPPYRFLKVVSEGKRPSLEGVEMPQILSQLIQACWATDPANRPTFDEIYLTILQNLISIIHGYGDIDENEVQEYIRKTK